jgi:hypothetical protein
MVPRDSGLLRASKPDRFIAKGIQFSLTHGWGNGDNMSIVITIVDQNKDFYIASDKRAKKNNRVDDNFKKIYKLSDNIFFGMTGIAEYGLVLFEIIKDRVNLPIKEFLAEVDKAFPIIPHMLTVVITGLDENKNYFIWAKNNVGEIDQPEILSENVTYTINSNDNHELFSKYFVKSLSDYHLCIQYSIADTIKYASSIDDSISPSYELYMLSK